MIRNCYLLRADGHILDATEYYAGIESTCAQVMMTSDYTLAEHVHASRQHPDDGPLAWIWDEATNAPLFVADPRPQITIGITAANTTPGGLPWIKLGEVASISATARDANGDIITSMTGEYLVRLHVGEERPNYHVPLINGQITAPFAPTRSGDCHMAAHDPLVHRLLGDLDYVVSQAPPTGA
jgi:hypothetical protein